MMMQKSALMLACLAGLLAFASAGPLQTTAVENWVAEFSEEEMSQLQLIPDNDQELAHLKQVAHSKPEMMIFQQFCIDSRDQVSTYLKGSANTAAAKIFNIMFASITDIVSETLKVQEEEVVKGVEMIKNSHLPVSDSTTENREQIAEDVVKRAETVKKSSLLQAVTEAVRNLVHSVVNAATSVTGQRLALLKANFSGENAQEKIDEACDDISYNLQKLLNNKLLEAKKDLKSSADPSLKDFISKVKIGEIGCVTTGRVAMVNRFCQFLKTVGPMIYPILGLSTAN